MQAHLQRSVVYRTLGFLQQAVADATMATQLAPANGDAHAHLGLAQFELKHYVAARSSFAMAVQLAPHDEGEARLLTCPAFLLLLLVCCVGRGSTAGSSGRSLT